MEDGIENPNALEHTSEKEAGFLARLLGWSIGRKQAGKAQPDVSELAKRVKELGPEAAKVAIDAAIASYSQIRDEERLKEEFAKPENNSTQ